MYIYIYVWLGPQAGGSQWCKAVKGFLDRVFICAHSACSRSLAAFAYNSCALSKHSHLSQFLPGHFQIFQRIFFGGPFCFIFC